MLMRAICAFFGHHPTPTTDEAPFAKKFDTEFSANDTNQRVINEFQTNEQLIRLRLFGKVMAILTCMLACTAFIVGYAMANYSYKILKILEAPVIFLLIPVAASFGLLVAAEKHQHLYPLNYIILAAFTVVQSIMMAIPCSMFAAMGMASLVIEAFAITTTLFGGLTVYALLAKTDLTPLKGFCVIALDFMIVYSLAGLIFGFTQDLVILVAGAALFCLFIVIDVQVILTRLGPDSAILGAITLYLDILNLFLKILSILAELDKAKSGGGRRRTTQR